MWLFTVGRNALANNRRATRRRHALVERLREHLIRPTAGLDPVEASEVRDVVRRLNPQFRELVMLVNWDGFTIDNAARFLGLNPSTARSRYAAAITELPTRIVASRRLPAVRRRIDAPRHAETGRGGRAGTQDRPNHAFSRRILFGAGAAGSISGSAGVAVGSPRAEVLSEPPTTASDCLR